MTQSRSFAEYVKDKCYNGLYAAADQYVESHGSLLDLKTRHLCSGPSRYESCF